MIKVREVIVVEGRYDKNTVSQVIDGTIMETAGFGIFSDSERIRLLRKLAEKRGVIILTDSDSAGFLIRGHLGGQLNGLNVKHAYIPDVRGREKRKRYASKEGTLGVEGMPPKVIIDALLRAGATLEEDAFCAENAPSTAGSVSPDPITKSDLYFAGLSGTHGSAEKRSALLKKLDLPEHLSTNALMDVLNALYERDEFLALLTATASE